MTSSSSQAVPFRGYYAALKWVMPTCGHANKNNVLALYMAVADYAFLAGGPFVGIDTICEKTGMSRSAVNRAIRDGKEMGILRAHKGRGQAGTSYWELAATKPFDTEKRDPSVQLSRNDVLGGKPANLSKSTKPSAGSDTTPHATSGASGHAESGTQVVLVESSKNESSELLTSNDADAPTREESTPSLPGQSFKSPTEMDSKTPLRERGVKWVHRAKWGELTGEEREQQQKLRDWQPRSTAVDDRVAAHYAYTLDATLTDVAEDLELYAWASGTSECMAMTAVRLMVTGGGGSPALSDADVKRVVDEVIVGPGEDPSWVLAEDYIDAVVRLSAGLGAGQGAPVPPEPREAPGDVLRAAALASWGADAVA